MPINWAANIPGNTITFMGFGFGNVPPIACYYDVRCGWPIFSTPTQCSYPPYTTTCTWPSESIGAGGAFDYYG